MSNEEVMDRSNVRSRYERARRFVACRLFDLGMMLIHGSVWRTRGLVHNVEVTLNATEDECNEICRLGGPAIVKELDGSITFQSITFTGCVNILDNNR